MIQFDALFVSKTLEIGEIDIIEALIGCYIDLARNVAGTPSIFRDSTEVKPCKPK